MARVENFIIREGGGTRFANSLVLGQGTVVTTAAGVPELVGARAGESQILPSGADDTQRLVDALARGNDVRLGPGTFRLSSPLVVGGPFAGGPAPRLIGSGPTRTRLKMSGTGPAVILRGDDSGIEALTVEGPGTGASGSTGIRVGEPPPIQPPEGVYFDLIPVAPRTVTGAYIHDVRVEKAETGIRLSNAAGCSVRDVTVADVAEAGISSETILEGFIPPPEPPRPLVLQNVRVENAFTGIALVGSGSVAASAVTVSQCSSAGVSVEGGSGHRLDTLRVYGCAAGLVLQGVRGAALEGVHVSGCAAGIQLIGSRDVALMGGSVEGANGSLLVQSSENVVIGALRSDMAGTSATPLNPHLRVIGSPGVFVATLRVANPSTPPSYEADVAQAGVRVLFGPHNLAAARINSGGNFAQL